jgi:hypothetical protein
MNQTTVKIDEYEVFIGEFFCFPDEFSVEST